jgi:protein-arginine kinase activator protein McsA
MRKIHTGLCNSCRSNTATHEVRNKYNAYMGHFCEKCAKKEMRRLNDEDKK